MNVKCVIDLGNCVRDKYLRGYQGNPLFLFLRLMYYASMIYVAADHRGFQLREELKKYLVNQGYEIEDVGALTYDETDDYVDFAAAAAEKMAGNPGDNRGIFVCGSGHGMDMAANKFPAVRAALSVSKEQAIQSREHEDSNVLILPIVSYISCS